MFDELKEESTLKKSLIKNQESCITNGGKQQNISN